MTATHIDLTILRRETLHAFRAYWHRRLNSRGGSWLALVMQEAAREMLVDIDAELALPDRPADKVKAQS